MRIKYSKDSLKFLAKMDKKTTSRIREAIAGLTKIPPEGDIKMMKGFDDGRKRLRVGGYRVVYRMETPDILNIIDIGNRGDIYK